MVFEDSELTLMRRALTIACAACDVDDDARAAWLDAQCGDDAPLRAEVEALLRHDRSGGESLLRVREPIADDGEDPLPGRRVGAYLVGPRLGSGGMGTVYRAEPVSGVLRQPVALKLIKRGMDSAEILARFMRERDILARLDHPNIARLLDGGMTDDGRPWFALELVDGEPLSAYCDRRRLDLDARIDLFVDLCEAVAYAHRNLVVHRDIKPGNLLVASDGTVKLLDFGIAKLVDATADEATRTIVPMMTPEYAAPEQFARGPITTQTDVYQLGVLLAELLGGLRRPGEGAVAGRPIDALHVGTLLREHGARHGVQALGVIAAARALDARGLLRALRGDLERIIRRATQVEPERRYASAGSLADDLRRYRAGLPVGAMGDRLGYRLRKFVQRHRGAVAAALAAALALGAGVALIVHDARALRHAERQTENALGLLETVFLGADPYAAKGGDTRAVDLLAGARSRIAADPGLDPALAARLLGEIGAAYVSLDDRADAESALRAAIEAGARAGAQARVAVAQARARLAHYGLVIDGDARQLPELEQAIQTLREAGAPAAAALAQALQLRLDHDFNSGNYAPIPQRSAEIVELTRRATGTGSNEHAMSLGNHASLLRAVGRERDALDAAEQAWHHVQAAGDAVPTAVRLYVEQQYAGALSANGRAADAEPVLRAAVALARASTGADSSLGTGLRWELAETLSAIGRFDESAQALRDLLRTMGESKNANVAAIHNALGSAQLALRDAAGAWREFEAAAALACVDDAASVPCLAIRLNQADAELDAAPTHARATLDALDATIGAQSGRARLRWRLLDSRYRLSHGDAAGARRALEPVLATVADERTDAIEAASILLQAAAIEHALGRRDAALAAYRDAERRMVMRWRTEAPALREARARIRELEASVPRAS